MTQTIEVDGSQGEGGGQILRTSLTLAMLYGLKLSLKNIRGKRPKPGLMRPIELIEKPRLTRSQVTAFLSSLPRKVAERELSRYQDLCRLPKTGYEIRHPDSLCPGNVLSHELHFGDVRVCFTELGRHRLRAEQVAENLAETVERYLTQEAVLCEHLTDQMMLPMLVAGGGCFSCGPLSRHAQTNSDLIAQLTGYQILSETQESRPVIVFRDPRVQKQREVPPALLINAHMD